MPKLFQISLCVLNASVGGITKQIGEKAIEHGWNSFITYTDQLEHVDCSSTLIKIGNKFDFYEHAIESRLFDNHGLASRLSTKKLIRKIDEIKPDIIHIQNLHGYYVNYKILFNYIKKHNIPVVWTLHDCWLFTGHCAYFDAVGCDRWKTGCFSCPNKKGYPSSIWLDRSTANYKAKKSAYGEYGRLYLVPVSEWLGNFVRQSFLSKSHINVIHNGIDTNVYRPCTNNLREKFKLGDKFVILGVANGFGERKGLADFVRLSEDLPSDEYQVVLIGILADDKAKLNEKIIAIQRTFNQQELIDFYSIADVFVNPTYEDNFPTTNIEALACGTPVITYRTGGSPEAVDEETGIVVEKGDYESLKKAIWKIRINTKGSYTQKCRLRAEREFNKDKCFEKYIELYNKILSNNGK